MFGALGIVLTVAMVFGGYALAGGKMGVILHALPFEMMIIGGAAAVQADANRHADGRPLCQFFAHGFAS